MSDDVLFDVFDQDEPSAIVELPENASTLQQTMTTTIM